MAQSDITTTCAALVLAGGSSDNPLARHRALPALEIGAAPAALPPPPPLLSPPSHAPLAAQQGPGAAARRGAVAAHTSSGRQG